MRAFFSACLLALTCMLAFACLQAQAAAASAAFASTLAAAHAAEDQMPIPCNHCKGRGVLPCKHHKKDEIEEEQGTLRCSQTVACEHCRGTFLMKCPRCKNPPEAGTAKAWEENEAWLARMREIDRFLGRKRRPIFHAESDHFILTYDIKTLPVGQKSVKTHDGLHLYLQRLEALYADVIKDLGAEDSDFLAKTHVMIWDRELDLVKTANKYCHQKSNTKSFHIGAKPVFTIYYNKGYLHEEFELHQAVVHNVVHCLLSNVWDGYWPGNVKGGWIDAGYAHHYELKYFGHLGGVRHYCYREGDTMTRFKYGKWEPSILTAVRNKETLSFLSIAGKNTDNLVPEEHMHAWSYVDFLIREHPDEFGEVCRLVKARKPIAEVMKGALGMSPFQFEEEWKEFVKANYQLKPKKKGRR
jgi:hypothetical protein